MPDKKLKVKEVGAGDPTFILKIQFENLDSGDSSNSITLDSLTAMIDGCEVENPVMDFKNVELPIGPNVYIMSSFNAPEPAEVGDTIPLSTTVTFVSSTSDPLYIENDTSLTGTITERVITESGLEERETSITFPDGIDALKPLGNSLSEKPKMVGLQARPADDPGGTNVFLVYDKKNDKVKAINNFISVSEYLWQIFYYESDEHCILYNPYKQARLMWDFNTRQLAWADASLSNSSKSLQWAIVSNGGKTSTIQSVDAAANGQHSYLNANTRKAGDNVKLSEDSSPWYLHILPKDDSTAVLTRQTDCILKNKII